MFLNLNTLTPLKHWRLLQEAALQTLYKLKKQKMAIQKRFSAVVEAVDLAFTPISSLITTK